VQQLLDFGLKAARFSGRLGRHLSVPCVPGLPAGTDRLSAISCQLSAIS
jgi:hypothetical protein